MLKGFLCFEEPGSSAFLVFLWLNQSFFLYLGGTSSILRTFRAEPVKKTPCNLYELVEKVAVHLSPYKIILFYRKNKVCQKYRHFIRGGRYNLGQRPLDQPKISKVMHYNEVDDNVEEDVAYHADCITLKSV